MRFTFTDREKNDLMRSWLAISAAFAIVMGGGLSTLFEQKFLILALIAAITVGLGFILHELAHKWMANRFNLHAEFHADNKMLIIALVTSLFGIVFAAPGAVYISGRSSLEQSGKISVAGPVMNLALALLFLLLYFTLSFGQQVLAWGFYINALLALFNMLPFGPFDGAKVLRWDKRVYGVVIAVAVLLTFLQTPLLGLGA